MRVSRQYLADRLTGANCMPSLFEGGGGVLKYILATWKWWMHVLWKLDVVGEKSEHEL